MQQVLFHRSIPNEFVLSESYFFLIKLRNTKVKSILLEITDAVLIKCVNDVTRATLVFARFAIAFVHLTFTQTLLFRATDKSVASLIYIH